VDDYAFELTSSADSNSNSEELGCFVDQSCERFGFPC